jgi:hypothetical protein
LFASGWSGTLEVDKPRHRLLMGFTRDWPRMNTMPEWFVAEPDEDYVVEDLTTGTTTTYTGAPKSRRSHRSRVSPPSGKLCSIPVTIMIYFPRCSCLPVVHDLAREKRDTTLRSK